MSSPVSNTPTRNTPSSTPFDIASFTQTAALLEFRGVRKTFGSGETTVQAIRSLDLAVHAGEFVVVMGPSGCGKSTKLHLAAGLETPTEGSVAIAGEVLERATKSELAALRRRNVGVVFQRLNHQSLVAIGASPKTIRRLRTQSSALLAFGGCVIAVIVALPVFRMVLWAGDNRSDHVCHPIPFVAISMIMACVTAAAALLGLLFRPRK